MCIPEACSLPRCQLERCEKLTKPSEVNDWTGILTLRPYTSDFANGEKNAHLASGSELRDLQGVGPAGASLVYCHSHNTKRLEKSLYFT